MYLLELLNKIPLKYDFTELIFILLLYKSYKKLITLTEF